MCVEFDLQELEFAQFLGELLMAVLQDSKLEKIFPLCYHLAFGAGFILSLISQSQKLIITQFFLGYESRIQFQIYNMDIFGG